MNKPSIHRPSLSKQVFVFVIIMLAALPIAERAQQYFNLESLTAVYVTVFSLLVIIIVLAFKE